MVKRVVNRPTWYCHVSKNNCRQRRYLGKRTTHGIWIFRIVRIPHALPIACTEAKQARILIFASPSFLFPLSFLFFCTFVSFFSPTFLSSFFSLSKYFSFLSLFRFLFLFFFPFSSVFYLLLSHLLSLTFTFGSDARKPLFSTSYETWCCVYGCVVPQSIQTEYVWGGEAIRLFILFSFWC